MTYATKRKAARQLGRLFFFLDRERVTVWDTVARAFGLVSGGWWTWRRPTLPRLKTQYHWRGGFSRPSSGWDRVRAPRCDHQVDQPPEGPWPTLSCLVRIFEDVMRLTDACLRSCVSCLLAGLLLRGTYPARRDQADRAISKAQLHALPRVHMPPIDGMVCPGS